MRKLREVRETEVAPYASMLSAAFSTEGRSIVILRALLCSVRSCEGLSFCELTANEGMQLGTHGNIVFEYKTKIPADLQSASAEYFDPVNTPSGKQISNAVPDHHSWHRGIFPGILNSAFRTPADSPKLPPTRHEEAYSLGRADFAAWGLYAPRYALGLVDDDITPRPFPGKLIRKAVTTQCELQKSAL